MASALKISSCLDNDHLENHEYFEMKIRRLDSPVICNKFRRVHEYVSDEKTKQLIKSVMPKKVAQGTFLVTSLTVGCGGMGFGVGGLIGNAPGAVIGTGVGGTLGFVLGVYLTKKLFEDTFHENYENWKKEVRDKECIREVSYLIRNDDSFESIIFPVSLEDFTCPVMIKSCGHTVDAKSLISIFRDIPLKEKISKLNAEPLCPLCMTKFTKENLETDVVKIAEMKKVYSSIAKDINNLVKNHAVIYSPEVLNAFKAMAADCEHQLKNIFLEASANLMLMMKENKISFDVYSRRNFELQERFKDILDM